MQTAEPYSMRPPHLPLHICLVCNTAWAMHTYRPGLIRSLLAHGVRVTVLSQPDRTIEPLRAMGVTCIDIPIESKGTNPLTDLKTVWMLWRQYRRLKPDLVFHYTIKPNIYGTFAAALAGVKSIAVTTGLGYVFIQHSLAARVAKQLYRLAFRFPREVWFLNPDDERTFLQAGLLARPERAALLPGEGIDLDQFPMTPLAADKPHFDFLLVGRLLWDKGVGEYAAAARIVKARHPQARFRLLGPAGVANPSAMERWNGWAKRTMSVLICVRRIAWSCRPTAKACHVPCWKHRHSADPSSRRACRAARTSSPTASRVCCATYATPTTSRPRC
jgi:glycosyltransferase involved in cell wall biosynthesis